MSPDRLLVGRDEEREVKDNPEIWACGSEEGGRCTRAGFGVVVLFEEPFVPPVEDVK